jgi:3-oxoacyl-[acyl-carrier protein] reductase
MKLGIEGRTAIVCGASKGLGWGCAAALAAEGVRIILNARDESRLQAAAAALRSATGAEIVAVPGDVGTEEARTALLAACPEPDILINNAGGPPPGDFREWGEADWHLAVQNNMVAPILLIKAVIDPMIARRFGRIVNITSAAVKAPYPALGLSNGARAGLTGFIAGLARQVVRHGVTVNNLLPGSHDTDRLRAVIARDAAARQQPFEAAYEQARTAEVAGRFGTPEEFGATCAFLCSAHAGFITGQNLLIDGGYYHGTL